MKKALRTEAKHMLQSLTGVEKHNIEKKQAKALFESTLWSDAQTIGVTISRGFEWDTKHIIESGWEQGKQMVVPKCNPEEKSMQFYRLNDFQQLETVYFGLQEPKPSATEAVSPDQIDLLLVPGLLFNTNGYRLGFGGGYYDRFLANFKGNTIMVASQQQKCESIPVEAFDRPVQYVLTEEGMKQSK
ncbi:5-formyltetrahydrofolate cyclo-ligase [Halobacillus salinus]|nr:5-formyltetrahydrofolate cyclo-ligase [Halobacillus salinus]